MIAKRVERKQHSSDYKRLAHYILDKKADGRKVREAWSTNCATPDDFDLAIKEVTATQALNTRSKIDKSYHLVISLAPGEDLTTEQWKDVETTFCSAIGLSEHQRICAIHSDTDHVHLHIAISKIHPEKLTAIEPYYDKFKLQDACRLLEQKYGLKPGIGDGLVVPPQEAHQGIEAFSTFVRDNVAANLLKLLAEPGKTWQDAQNLCGQFGIEIRERGAGLVFSHTEKNLFVKASSIDRGFSKAKLEKAFGPFERSQFNGTPEKVYQPRPLHGGKSAKLYAEYKEIREREWADYQKTTGDLGQTRSEKLAEIKARYAKRRLEIKRDTLIAKGRKREIYRKVSEQMKKELDQLYSQTNRERGEAKDGLRAGAWRDWLRERATNGDEEALGALRVKRQQKDQAAAFAGSFSGEGKNQTLFSGLNRQVHKDGNVEYKTAEGRIIVETGRAILVKTAEPATIKAAFNMATALFGDSMKVSGSEAFLAKVKAMSPSQEKTANSKSKKLDHDNSRS